ncbi:NUDIX domain-containing protein [Trichoderma breve]|uniref:NUDIX domain-containing protein n=1 Tax=Trichoderma breve TaxID=2034170 RepID=A0A9W9B6E2_9HYPO|nr:NUDIX domain-containing protein [Trichoderma breve]KAJ4854353.1 NUDIX domain-containing protein [Trichoderma breve]
MSVVNTAVDTNSKGGPIADFAFDESLIEWTVPKSDWLEIHDKNFDGVATSAYIFDAQGRVLLVQRAAHDSMPNLWETPGGAVDSGDDSILAGCAREVREEVGLVARRMKRLVTEGEGRGKWSVFTNRSGTRVFCGFAFEVEVDEGEVVLDPEEHQAFVWAGEEEIRRGVVGGRRIALSCLMVRNRLMEAFRLRREDGVNGV